MKIAKRIAQVAQMACILEACAPKPGNVNRAHDFPDTSLDDFLLSAAAIGPAFEKADRAGIGQIVEESAVRTRSVVKTNTNLGLILLLAPLVKACVAAAKASRKKGVIKISPEELRPHLHITLNSLTVEDARQTYAAVRLARPGGLGKVSEADIGGEPSITLLQAMALAQERDSIAREYVTDYAITFEIGLPALRDALCRDRNAPKAIVQAFLTILMQVPDTLIARKRGSDTAGEVSQHACDVVAMGGVYTPEGRAALAEMDRRLRDKAHTLNPGTTADLTAGAVFLSLLESRGVPAD